MDKNKDIDRQVVEMEPKTKLRDDGWYYLFNDRWHGPFTFMTECILDYHEQTKREMVELG